MHIFHVRPFENTLASFQIENHSLNDLVDNISSEAKLFADDMSLFTVLYDLDMVANKLNRGLEIISTWAYQ